MGDMIEVDNEGSVLRFNNSYYETFDHSFLPFKANLVFIIYKITEYNNVSEEQNYLFHIGDTDDARRRGICFLKDKRTMRIYGATGKGGSNYTDVSNFYRKSDYNPCAEGHWNVIGIQYDEVSDKSTLWVNNGKVIDFKAVQPAPSSAKLLLGDLPRKDLKPSPTCFKGDIANFEVYEHSRPLPDCLIQAQMTSLSEEFKLKVVPKL